MSKLTTGAVVNIKGYVTKGRTYGNQQTTLIEIAYSKPVKVLVLGKSQRHTGTLSGYSNYDDPYSDGNYLTDIVAHPVWMVMPIVNGSHFRKPIAVLEGQILP